MIRLVICGIGGRMGSRICALAQNDSLFQVVYGLESPAVKPDAAGVRTGSDPREIKGADVVIDFTTAEATVQLAREVGKYNKAYVVGTTGLTDVQRKIISEVARDVPVVQSPNMSLGMNVFFQIAEESARALPGYAVDIVEAHHKHKQDAPSGTALYVGGLIEKATGKSVKYQSIREGEIVGDHRVIFSGPAERLELFHHAESRDAFAAGALAAAKWIVKQKPGLYTMKDVLGL